MPNLHTAITGLHAAPADLLTLAEMDGDHLRALFALTARLKADITPYRRALDARSIVMLFEKPSLRTRLSFEVGIAKLGGHPIYFDHAASPIGQRESVKDYAKNLERWVDCIIARVKHHSVLQEMAAHSSVPVINALSDLAHPCQALADFFTLQERLGTLEGKKLAFIGDGNNVCHSLIMAAAKLGVSITVVAAKGFEPQFSVLQEATRCISADAKIRVTSDPAHIAGHDAVYTDVWVSMGQDAQTEARNAFFEDYQVNDAMMARAGSNALFMHCLPAKRGQEVTDSVIDSPNSVVYDQAENRMHVQNALLLHMLAGIELES
ncbi:MAG: ornithine carbamoyltransferase [Phycisphaerales bacterium]